MKYLTHRKVIYQGDAASPDDPVNNVKNFTTCQPDPSIPETAYCISKLPRAEAQPMNRVESGADLMQAIEIRRVTKRFDGVTAVDDLSLAVPSGSIYGFIGPNGSGKTTTIRMILSILLPDTGEIAVLGSRDPRAARDRVGYLPEERGLYKKMTARRLLRYYGRLKGASTTAVDAAANDWLARLGLSEYADRRIEALSKGMSQKLQFIASVVAGPELLILDEPFSGLDPVNADVLRDAVLEMRRRGTTIVFSTHDMTTAEKMCDRIFMIFKGRKVLDGTLHDIQEQYGADTVRLRVDGGVTTLARFPEIEAINDYGQLQEVRLRDDPQAFLARLTASARVHHFEVTRPSLHDIFVRIARPSAAAAAVNRAAAGGASLAEAEAGPSAKADVHVDL
jgi:ABC-2 type transport system ATP-binding protein